MKTVSKMLKGFRLNAVLHVARVLRVPISVHTEWFVSPQQGWGRGP